MNKDNYNTPSNEVKKMMNADKAIIIYDGVCYLCNGSIHFIIARDTQNQFIFTPLQSDFAQTLMQKYNVEHLVQDTFILIKEQQVYMQSDAAIEISQAFRGIWRLFTLFKWIPKPLRDGVYRLIAQNRYRLFGKADSCLIPKNEIKGKFIL